MIGHIMHWDDKRKYMGEIWRQQGAMRLEAARRDKPLALLRLVLLGDKPDAAILDGRQ